MFKLLFMVMLPVLLNTIAAAEPTIENTPLPEDVITPKGNFVKYRASSDSTYVVFWENKDFKRKLDEFQVSSDSGYPRFKLENDKSLILRAGCGSPCWTGFILPLNAMSPVRVYSMPLAYDMERNLVVLPGEFRPDTMLWVENFVSSAHQAIPGPGCPSAFVGYCVDSLSFRGNELYIRWITDFEKDSRQENRVQLHLTAP
jgi:hypothetical protein